MADLVSGAMFTNARNPVINGGTFMMQGDFHSHHVTDDRRWACESIISQRSK
jgi:hypothetical protein